MVGYEAEFHDMRLLVKKHEARIAWLEERIALLTQGMLEHQHTMVLDGEPPSCGCCPAATFERDTDKTVCLPEGLK